MAYEASREQFHNLEDLFEHGGSGFITLEELATVIMSFDWRPAEEELWEMIEEIDDNREGIVEFLQFFNRMTSKNKEADTEEELEEAFKVFDKDQNGFISPNELRQVMMNLGEKLTEDEAEQMIREADLDGDGLVNYDDFVHLMTSLV